MKPSLRELAEKWSVDKLHFHSYIEPYTTLFENRTVGRVLELGIGYEHLMAPLVPRYIHGASLYLWHDVWPDAIIFSCDIRPETLFQDSDSQIFTVLCDQTKLKDLWALVQWTGGRYDVVIDDGLHEAASQILTAAVLLPHVMPGGCYVVEDCSEPDRVAEAIGGTIYRGSRRADDNLVIVEKPHD